MRSSIIAQRLYHNSYMKKWRGVHVNLGLCMDCKNPAISKLRCAKHLELARVSRLRAAARDALVEVA